MNSTIDRITVENGEELQVDDRVDYRCDECSSVTLEVWHTDEDKADALFGIGVRPERT